MAMINGETIIARALKTQGVETIFGVVGIPVSGIATAAQHEGIRYYGMRHEMPATYAGQATGYLNGRIGVSLVVSGPGALNAVGAFANAWSNRWPLLMLGGASDSTRADMGDFQEAEQVAAMAPYAKYARRAESTERLPLYVAEAVRKAINGTPGPSYLDLPGNIIFDEVDEDSVEWAPRVPDPPRLRADDAAVQDALAALKTAEQPLIVIGKGIAFGRAEAEMRRFVEQTGIPYLAMPMARGVLPDDHPQSIAAARSFVLKNTDLAFLAAARLNWMLHFGQPPRWREDVRVVQLDSNPEEIGVNVPTEVGLVGDAKVTLGQLLDALDEEPWQFPQDSEWLQTVRSEARKNQELVNGMIGAGRDGEPFGYYTTLRSGEQGGPSRRDLRHRRRGHDGDRAHAAGQPRSAPASRCRQLRIDGPRSRLRDRGPGRAPGPARDLRAGRLGVRLRRHGVRGRGAPQAPDHLGGGQQQRYRRHPPRSLRARGPAAGRPQPRHRATTR